MSFYICLVFEPSPQASFWTILTSPGSPSCCSFVPNPPPAFNPWWPFICLHLCSFYFFRVSCKWICYFSCRDDQTLTDMDLETWRVYLGLQFAGEVHHGRAAFGSGILHPLSEHRVKNVCVQFSCLIGSQPKECFHQY